MGRFGERVRRAMKAVCIVAVLAAPAAVEFYPTPAHAGSIWHRIVDAIKSYVKAMDCDPRTDPMYGMLG